MGIISRGHTPDRQRTGATIIAAGTKLVGDLALSDSLHVDGRVEGSIQSDGEVSIGEQGSVDGDIRAVRVMVCGEFSGSIEAERLEIVATGKVSGEVTVEQLVIESGAQFNGTSQVKSEQPAPQLGHDRKASNGKSAPEKKKTPTAEAEAS